MVEEQVGKHLLSSFILFDSLIVAQIAQAGFKPMDKHYFLDLQILALSEMCWNS